jgi:hypothetical protein
VKFARLPGDPLADHSGVRVNQDAHSFFSTMAPEDGRGAAPEDSLSRSGYDLLGGVG